MDTKEQPVYEFITPGRVVQSVTSFLERNFQQPNQEPMDISNIQNILTSAIEDCKDEFYNYRQMFRSIPDAIKDSMNVTFATMALIKTKAPPEFLNLYVITDLMKGNTRNLHKHFEATNMAEEDKKVVGLALSLYGNRFQAASKEFRESKLWMIPGALPIANLVRRIKKKSGIPFPSEFLDFDRKVIATVFPPPKKQDVPKRSQPESHNTPTVPISLSNA